MSGELTLTLGQERIVLRPSFAALSALEQDAGTGLITLARRFAEGNFTLSDCVAIVRAGILGAGGVVPPNLGELIVAGGLAALSAPLSRFLRMALTGESDAGKE